MTRLHESEISKATPISVENDSGATRKFPKAVRSFALREIRPAPKFDRETKKDTVNTEESVSEPHHPTTKDISIANQWVGN